MIQCGETFTKIDLEKVGKQKFGLPTSILLIYAFFMSWSTLNKMVCITPCDFRKKISQNLSDHMIVNVFASEFVPGHQIQHLQDAKKGV